MRPGGKAKYHRPKSRPRWPGRPRRTVRAPARTVLPQSNSLPLFVIGSSAHAPTDKDSHAPRSKQGRTSMTMRPDPTFHASPKLAMEAPPENFAYTLLLSPDFSKPDALAVIDTKPGSPTFSRIVHTVTMPYKGDEFHHFGWNACSSALSPLTGHAFLERR